MAIFRISRDEDGLYLPLSRYQFMRQIAAIPVGQDYVREQQLHLFRMTAKSPDRFGRVSCRQHTVARRAQDFASHLANKSFVFHQQDGCELRRLDART